MWGGAAAPIPSRKAVQGGASAWSRKGADVVTWRARIVGSFRNPGPLWSYDRISQQETHGFNPLAVFN
eukprot:2861402-Prymnesium_polylepis.1